MAGTAAVEAIGQVTRYLDLAGVFACAILGGAVARAEQLDLFGYLVVGTVSGLGGGVIRDTLLQHGPPVALTDYAYLPTAMAGALLSFVMTISESSWNRVFTALDAAVVGLWAVTGAQKTLAAGLGWLPAILLGTTTAVGGGALRDIMLRRVPAVLGRNGLYATVAVAVASVMVVCSELGAPLVGVVSGVVGALAFRGVALAFDWNLPSGLEWHPRARLREGRRSRPRPPEEGGA
ncbi:MULTISPECIES: trimeric intracellular cation channel family protein [Amycolatopsis]|uniref:TRIC cation channel family protein n=1 Tax=Amycolatopsis echigonensis TaxID=2576905 RepID=A0A8E1W3B4_9PSEU|nr:MULTISPECIES: TRIC cation channel family protein [Amycolatopsis]MBB2502993.1 TRIC cation channel family protein [Amycolatopsis echigonensis]